MSRRRKRYPAAKVWADIESDEDSTRRCLLAMPWQRCLHCGRALLRLARHQGLFCSCDAHGYEHLPFEFEMALVSTPVVAQTRRLAANWTIEDHQPLQVHGRLVRAARGNRR